MRMEFTNQKTQKTKMNSGQASSAHAPLDSRLATFGHGERRGRHGPPVGRLGGQR